MVTIGRTGKSDQVVTMLRHTLHAEKSLMLPHPSDADAGDEHYDAFVHKHSRRHLSKQEYQQRSQRFHEVKGMVEVCTFCLLVFPKALQRMAL